MIKLIKWLSHKMGYKIVMIKGSRICVRFNDTYSLLGLVKLLFYKLKNVYEKSRINKR